MADLSKLRFDGTDYNVKDASAPTRKFTNTYSKTGNLPISSDDTTQTAIGKLENNIIPKSAKGTANGVAELDANGKVPSSQLPSYVDDVLEYSAKSSFPATGESGKIYVDTTTNKTYRWSGSAYVEISESLALGETDSTAYRGDRGKTAYDHSQRTSGNPHNVTKSDVGLGNVGNFKAVSTVASQGLSDTEKSNARANIGAGTGNGTYSKPSGGIPKSDLATAVQTALDQVNTNKTNILYTLDKTGKNLWDFANVQVPQHPYNATYTKNDSAITVTSNGAWGRVALGTQSSLKAGSYVFRCKISNYSRQNGGPYIFIQDAVPDATVLYATEQVLGNGIVEIPFVLPSDGVVYIAYYGNATEVTGSTDSYTASENMICTEADWNISKNYTPFALPNSDLTQGLAELNAHPFLTVPINHNMVYRGKNLGDTLTDAQHTALSGGNFTDLYLGDYWTKSVTIPAFYEVTTSEPSDWSTNYTSYYTKSGDTYTPVSGDTAPTWAANTYYERLVPEQTVTLKAVIADFDTFYAGYASTYAGINTHHAAVIVTGFSNVVWNSTNTTAGGYVNSLIHKWLVGSVLPQIETWFGSAKVLSHQKLLTNAITGDSASEWAWSSQKISLLSENQVYGSKIWGNSKATNGGYEPGEAFKHLNVFNHIDANLLFGNKNIWLRDIASAVGAAYLHGNGYADLNVASNSWIAPAALILLS